MTTTDHPKARQSQLVTTYGVGSLFPAGDQSLMICGIDEWDESWSLPVEEPRLARSLGVNVFRSPSTGQRRGDVPVVRFPTVHYCPNCRRLDAFWRFDAKRMRCSDCERDLTPSRFVACCDDGHIEDFPYFQWLHRGSPMGVEITHRMTLTSKGSSSSLADIVVNCSCGVKPYSLEGSFSRGALREIKRCGGSRPWLPQAEPEVCDRPLRVLQRGSSNVWFSAVRSAISIPPWSSPDARFVNRYWKALEHLSDSVLESVLPSMLADDRSGARPESVLSIVRRRLGLVNDAGEVPSESQLRAEEYAALVEGNDASAQDSFQCRAVDVDPSIDAVVSQVSAVDRLREVRALFGFTRVTATPTETTSPRIAKLSLTPRDWLPATEVLGEGVFFRISENVLRTWESSSFAHERSDQLRLSVERRSLDQGIEMAAPSTRYLALHSLAHAVLKELSLDAGYPVGSLRERVYADDGQSGILIYTASSDAAGSLGGLAALAGPELFARAWNGAMSRSGWCSNDPVCAESGPSGSDGLNLAACHACLLVPETSCEARNIFLDRVILVDPLESLGRGLGGAPATH